MEIRKAAPSDRMSLLELIKPFQSAEFNWSPEVFTGEFASTECWLLETEFGIQSFVCLRDAVDAYEMSVLATRQGQQKKGYMSSLIQHIQQVYGFKRQLWLEVHEKNLAAQKLYRKLGFQQTGARGGYYQDGSQAFLFTFNQVK